MFPGGFLTPQHSAAAHQKNAAGRATCASAAPACRTPKCAVGSNASLDIGFAEIQLLLDKLGELVWRQYA